MNSCFSVAFIRYVFSFDTGEERRQTLDFSVVAFLKSKLLRNSWHLIGRQHNAESEEHILRKGQKPQEKQCCLHKCGKADCDDLLAPLVEAVGIAPWYAEHI